MKNKKLSSIISAFVIFVITGVMLSSCSNKITEEQLLQIKELRKQDKLLDDKIATQKAELSEIEKELAARKAILNDCNKRQDYVKAKLNAWPNIWPDWKPEPPAPVQPPQEPAPVKK